MKKIKLAKLPDRVPVKMTVTLPAELAAQLRGYADLYAEQYGVREEPTELVPYILDAFFKTDVEFRRAIREKEPTKTGDDEPDPSISTQTRIEPASVARDLRVPRRPLGYRSDTSEG